MRREHTRCFWCGGPIFMDEDRESLLSHGTIVSYHRKCFEDMKHSSGITYTLEGCAVENDDD